MTVEKLRMQRLNRVIGGRRTNVWSIPASIVASIAAWVGTMVAPSIAEAHDFWIQREGSDLALRYGHRGGERLPIEQTRVKASKCLEKGATRDLLAQAKFTSNEVRFAVVCGSASAFYDGGTWSLTPDGEVEKPKNEVAQAVRSWTSRQFAKWIDARSQEASHAVLNDELELVAVGDISKAREGDKITVRVLSRGAPVDDAVVAIDHKALGESDSRGEVRLRLRTSGVETISATVRRPLSTPESDSLVLEASLSFEVAK